MKTKYYHLFADGVDSNGDKHTVTVVGKFTQEYIQKPFTDNVSVEVKPNSFVNGKLTFNKRTLHRKLTIGVSICNPTDEFNEAEGVRIGKKRIEEGKDAGSVETNDPTMLTEDLILAEMIGKLSYITTNIDKYVGVEDEADAGEDLDFDIDSQAIGI